ncbi:MAG TPA: thiol:disulfide interchange protein DsbA/DsbL [Burkholderiales bacterium]|nr:thiol:disulfide interchange protein DsbA/DsbL [Burkholderiales bacterium]
MKFFRSFFFLALLFSYPLAHAGQAYSLVDPPQPTASGKKIEVLEFFYYGCPHCYHLQKYLDPWLKKLPKDVEFRYIPTIFNAQWEKLARTYYALDVMGLEPKLHGAVYDAVQLRNIDLGDEATLLDWAAKRGIDRAKLSQAYSSFSAQVDVNKSKQMTRSYGIMGTPSLVVDGKYLTSPELTQSLPGTITELDKLIAMARAARH